MTAVFYARNKIGKPQLNTPYPAISSVADGN
jgi:hypothetical protein